MVDETGEVVKWYTRARKFPTLIGKTPDGTRLPGGPYTITQVLVGAALAVLLASPPWWWTRFFDPMTNVAIFVLVVGGGVFFSGRLPIGLRNPLTWGSGVFRSLTQPPGGSIAGKPVRLRAAHTSGGHAVMVLGTEPAVNTPADALHVVGEEPAVIHPAPALTGVQRLLAVAAVPQEQAS